MNVYEIVGNVTAVISFFSLIGNVLQYTKKRENEKTLRRLAQEHYNYNYYIGRSLTRVRNEEGSTPEEQLETYRKECNYIRGIADTARESLICFGREELKLDVYFEHPAYPGKKEYSDDVLMGMPIDKEK